MNKEKIVGFKVISKADSRIYLNGTFDINSYDEDTDMGDWEYEQNDGTFSSHIPSYWKVNGENLSFEFDQFIDSIDFDMLQQALFDFQDESWSCDRGSYLIHINYGACVEIDISKDDSFEETYTATLSFKYNTKPMELDEDILRDLAENIRFDDIGEYSINKAQCSIHCEIPKTFSDYYDSDEEYLRESQAELINEYHVEGMNAYARQLTKNAGIYSTHGEFVEQCVEEDISSDRSEMFAFKVAVEDDTVEKFLSEHGYINE